MEAAVKWSDPKTTASGAPRAWVEPKRLEMIWFNTGTLCNIACANCYIESSPRNDRLSYLEADDVRRILNEAEAEGLAPDEVGFTGGEPFLNPGIDRMLGECSDRGYRTLVLTNAMKPMMNRRALLHELNRKNPESLRLRVSLDHHTAAVHDAERGDGSFETALEGLSWLSARGFSVAAAGRSLVEEEPRAARDGYAALFKARGIAIDAADPAAMIIFPEMDGKADPPEITTECWKILKKPPDSVMCSSSRMVVRRKGEPSPVVTACTLIPHDERFTMGRTLKESWRPVSLRHPYCASFCVLGGASCGD